jgi:hypothetical protein
MAVLSPKEYKQEEEEEEEVPKPKKIQFSQPLNSSLPSNLPIQQQQYVPNYCPKPQ